MYTKVFINVNGELNFKEGRIASSDDLIFDVCCGNKEINGLLELSDGYWMWFNNMSNKISVEEVGEICEYICISTNKVTKDVINNCQSIAKTTKLVACY